MDGIREGIADPGKLSLVAPMGIGTFYIAVIAFNGLVGIVTQPHTMSNCAAGRTEMDGRFGWMFGNLIKRVCTIPWCLTGVAAVVYFAGKGVEVEPEVYCKNARSSGCKSGSDQFSALSGTASVWSHFNSFNQRISDR